MAGDSSVESESRGEASGALGAGWLGGGGAGTLGGLLGGLVITMVGMLGDGAGTASLTTPEPSPFLEAGRRVEALRYAVRTHERWAVGVGSGVGSGVVSGSESVSSNSSAV